MKPVRLSIIHTREKFLSEADCRVYLSSLGVNTSPDPDKEMVGLPKLIADETEWMLGCRFPSRRPEDDDILVFIAVTDAGEQVWDMLFSVIPTKRYYATVLSQPIITNDPLFFPNAALLEVHAQGTPIDGRLKNALVSGVRYRVVGINPDGETLGFYAGESHRLATMTVAQVRPSSLKDMLLLSPTLFFYH